MLFLKLNFTIRVEKNFVFFNSKLEKYPQNLTLFFTLVIIIYFDLLNN